MDAQLELHEGSQIADRFWRLNNLYTIQTKEGNKAPFRLNWAQAELLRDLHECSLILKARQLGFTTFIQIFMPSTPEEAFEASIEGAYFADQLAAAELQGRIGDHRLLPDVPVNTAWDIGVGDYTSIWFWQQMRGKIGLVGYYQNCGEGMPHYVEHLKAFPQAHRMHLRNPRLSARRSSEGVGIITYPH